MLPQLVVHLLVIQAGSPSALPSAYVGHPDDAAARVAKAVAEWRASAQPAEGLTARLTAIGRPAEPHVIELLATARKAAGEGPEAQLPAPALIAALGHVGGSSSLAPLAAVLETDALEARVAAARALGTIGLIDGLGAVLEALDDDSVLVRSAAAESSLAVVAGGTAEVLIEALEDRWEEHAHFDQIGLVLGRLGTPEAREIRCDHVSGLDSEASALGALGGLWLCADEDDAAVVLDLLRSSSALAVQRKACLVLGRVEHGPAVEFLIELLSSDERGLGADAHWALKSITGVRLRADRQLWERWWEGEGVRRFGQDGGDGRAAGPTVGAGRTNDRGPTRAARE